MRGGRECHSDDITASEGGLKTFGCCKRTRGGLCPGKGAWPVTGTLTTRGGSWGIYFSSSTCLMHRCRTCDLGHAHGVSLYSVWFGTQPQWTERWTMEETMAPSCGLDPHTDHAVTGACPSVQERTQGPHTHTHTHAIKKSRRGPWTSSFREPVIVDLGRCVNYEHKT